MSNRVENARGFSAKAAMLAVETKLFPLHEIIDGTDYRITHQPQGLPVRSSPRFRVDTATLHDDVVALQKEVDEDGNSLWQRQKGVASDEKKLVIHQRTPYGAGFTVTSGSRSEVKYKPDERLFLKQG